MKRLLLLGVMTIITSLSIYAQTYPGGVTGAEVWYKADSLDITNNQYLNFAETEITLNDCGDHQPSLYNFNPSIHAEDQLCLIYRVPIENVSERDIFFVGLTDPNPEISYLTTQWHHFEQQQPLIVSFDSIVRNHFDISNQKTYINKLVGNYSSVKNAHVNYYHWNQFDIDRKFKSYGELGETYIYIGKDYTDKESQDPVEYFKGKFPEYLSFPYPLSANEKNRVESYLALKYGITLSSSTSYKNSSNTVFWEKENNGIFYNNIFGMGRDDLSGLYQVQSNSMHYEGKLISSIDQKYKYSNEELLKVTSLPNDHFIVFGDNEQADDDLRGESNSKGVEILNRIWLSQSTGDYMQEFPVFFCLESAFLYDIIDSHNNEKGNEENQWVLWMLHDKYTSHDEESDFNSEFVNYYKPYEREDITACYGMVITEGEEPVEEPIIFFDGDLNKYDQFTFGVGPEIIVQFQHTGCNHEEGYETEIIITGGQGPYTIKLIPCEEEGFEVEVEPGEGNNTILNVREAGILTHIECTYEVIVTDANGVTIDTTFEIEPQIIDIDLGPDQILNTSQPTTVLEGNAYVQDPDATYQWYYNGELMLHTDPILEVGTPGEYTLVITNGDRTCTVTDTIVISNEFHCDVTETQYCEPIYLSDIHIDVTGGFFTYHTNIKSIDGGGIDYSQAHNDDTTLSDIPPGGYLITVRDKLGAICTKEIEIGCYGGKGGQDQAGEESIASKNENTQSSIEDQVLATKIYPNPSNAHSNFHYEVSCGNEINGVVEIFNTSGAILQRKEIRGSSTYRLQFNLLTSGLYFIRVSSDAGSKVDKIIIR